MPHSKTLGALLLFFSAFLSSVFCFGQDSRIRPVIGFNYKYVAAPPGMVYIPGGSTYIKYDQSSTDTNSLHKVSLTSFFIDKTEVTNEQYREFTEWVIDSIAVVKYLKDDKYFYDDDNDNKSKSDTALATAGNNATVAKPADTSLTPAPPPGSFDTASFNAAFGNGKPAAADTAKKVAAMSPTDTNKIMPVDTNKLASAVPVDTSGPVVGKRINWSKVNHDKIFNPKNDETWPKLQAMIDENGNIKKEFYMFTYPYLKVNSTKNETVKNRVAAKETLNIYPDETCWAQDLTNSQTDMYVENYFKAPPFDDYPVVGVNWLQARAYCYWRSLVSTGWDNMPDYMKYYKMVYTLPSEAQWMYAAQGYYDMIVADDSDLSNEDTSVAVVYPTDSTVTPHDSAWVAQYISQHTPGADTAAMASAVPDSAAAARAALDSARTAAREKRAEERAERMAKKRAEERFNYTIADFLTKGKYEGKYYYTKNGGELANSGGINGPDYDPDHPPIDSSAIHFDQNGMLSNFKQDEGDYWEDGSALSLPVMAYAPNEWGLYNMEGNVAEWVMDAYSPSAFSFVSDLNPELLYDADSSDADAMKRKVVRGGSFMSNAKSLDPYYRDMEMQDVSHCFIGFRCVMQAPEVLGKNVATRKHTIRGNKPRGFGEFHLQELH